MKLYYLRQLCSACCHKYRFLASQRNTMHQISKSYSTRILRSSKCSKVYPVGRPTMRHHPKPWAGSGIFTTIHGGMGRNYSSIMHRQHLHKQILDHVHIPRHGGQLLLGFPSVRHVTGGDDGLIYIPTPVEVTYELLEYFHDEVCLSWCLAIAATTLLYRSLLVFPLAVLQQKILARIENAQPLINTLAERAREQIALDAKEEDWSKARHQEEFDATVKAIVRSIHRQEKCAAYRLSYVPIAHLGIWVSITMALGQMSGWYPGVFFTETDIDVLPSLASGGLLWFTDLMQADIVIPILLGVVNLTLVELWSLRRGPLMRMQERFLNVARVAAIASMPAAVMMPSVISFYWLVSSTLGVAQFALLQVPRVRRLLKIPQTPSEMRAPLEEMKTALRIKYQGQKYF